MYILKSTMCDNDSNKFCMFSFIMQKDKASEYDDDVDCDGDYDNDGDDDDEEIPIWICGEPRFVSGIMSATTCNDVIQALIDDELSNVNPLSKFSFSFYFS